jgi:uncharacterized protein
MSAQPHPAGSPGASSDDRNWAVIAHLSALIAFIGLPSLIGPLIVWLLKREQPFVSDHSREALNFNLSVFIYVVVGGLVLGVLVVATHGIALLVLIPAAIAVFAVWLVFVIQAAMRASRGELFRYPLTLRLIS